MCTLGNMTSETLLHLLYLNPILLDDVLDDIIFLISNDFMLTLDIGNAEEI